MKARGAVVRSAPGSWEAVDLEFEEPRQGELLIRMVASGLCHSDDHLTTGDIPVGHYPMCGGHEGAGVVEKVGPNTPGYERAITSSCRSCPAAGGAGGAPRACRTCATSVRTC